MPVVWRRLLQLGIVVVGVAVGVVLGGHRFVRPPDAAFPSTAFSSTPGEATPSAELMAPPAANESFAPSLDHASSTELIAQSPPTDVGSSMAQTSTVIARVVEDFAPVRAEPGSAGAVLWRLYEGTQVAVGAEARDAQGGIWHRIRLWNSGDGWLADDSISFDPYPPPPPPPARTSPPPTAPQPPREPRPARSLIAPALIVAPAAARNADGGETAAAFPAGSRVTVDAWAVGADELVRYHVTDGSLSGWVAPSAVAFDAADAPTRTVNGRPIVEPLEGKGMWFVLDSREHGEQAAARVAAAARANGISHIYVEVATSRGGFFGTRWLDELLPAAQAAGVKVIGSVYVWLDDVPADLDLALAVARYRTADGRTLDGLTADIEERLVADNVQAFGELLRHHLGDDYLLVATTYPPRSFAAPRYPWAAIARSWNAIAPMAYWRQMRGGVLTPEEVYAYTRQEIEGVRELTRRPDLPVEMLGQLFELGRPRLLGPDPPAPAELEASVAGARDAGAVGISFFDWTRATPAHWEALAAFEW